MGYPRDALPMGPDEIRGDSGAEEPQSVAQSVDETSLDELFEHALQAVEAGEELGLEGWLAGREHLSGRAQEIVRMAREVAVNVERPIPEAAREVAGFEILHQIGRGSMASVFLARQLSLGGRLVALKVLPSSAALSPRARARFVAEARALAKLRHAHVVIVHDVVESGDLCAYAMDWIEGATLAQVIAALREERSNASIARILGDSSGVLSAMTPTVFACRVGIAIARALGAVHRAGLLHRDVKPSNILLRRDGTPVLSDFGLVRESDSGHLTRSGQYVGTPSYSAPEQLHGDLDAVDARSDVYSLGVTLYEALTLRLPYSGRSPAEILARAEAGSLVPLRKVDAALPRDLETIVAKALDPDREQRYASADELADDLERLLALQPIHARPASVATRLAKWARRNRRALAAAATAALLVAVPVTWLARHAIERAGADDRALAALAQAQQALLDPKNLYPMFVVAHGNSTERMAPASQRMQGALKSYDEALSQLPSAELAQRIEVEREVVALSAVLAERPGLPSVLLSGSCPLAARVARDWHAQATGSRASPEDIAATHPDDRRQLGLLAFLLGEAGLSIDAWRDVSLAFPADPLAEASLGELHLERGEPQLAYPRLLRACDAYPDAGFLVVELADAAAQLGELDVAERLLTRAGTLPLSNDYDGAVLIRADIAAGRGEDTRAEELYRWMMRRYQRTSPYEHYATFLRARGRLGDELAIRSRLFTAYSTVAEFRRKLVETAELWWRSESEVSVAAALRGCLDKPYREFGTFRELLRIVLDSSAEASGSGNDELQPNGGGNARDSMLPPGASASGGDSGHSLRWLACRVQTHFQPEEYAPMFPFSRSLYCRALLGESPELATASIVAVDRPIRILWRAFSSAVLATFATAAVASDATAQNCGGAPCFQGLGDLPGGTYSSFAMCLSSDGTCVGGGSATASSAGPFDHEAFRWRADTGMVYLGDLAGNYDSGQVDALSADGSVAVGWSSSGWSDVPFYGYPEAFRWTEAGGMIGLGDTPGGLNGSKATGVSDDGATLCGHPWGMNQWGSPRQSAIWTSATDWVIKGPTDSPDSAFSGMSRDGVWAIGRNTNAATDNQETIRWSETNGYEIIATAPDISKSGMVGYGVSDDGIVAGIDYSSLDRQAWVWTSGSGMQMLGDLTGGAFYSEAYSITRDGALIVGLGTSASGNEAVLWDEQRTLHLLSDYLECRGVTIPTGWTLTSCTDVVENAGVLTLCGDATNPSGDPEGWLARCVRCSCWTTYCTATPNSTGAPADLTLSGSTSSAAGDLLLRAEPVPNQFGIFFHAMNQAEIAFGNGYLCATGDIKRGAVIFTSGQVGTYLYDNSDAKHSLASYVGSMRNFQFWFRDPMGGGAFFNLSNAISLTVCP